MVKTRSEAARVNPPGTAQDSTVAMEPTAIGGQVASTTGPLNQSTTTVVQQHPPAVPPAKSLCSTRSSVLKKRRQEAELAAAEQLAEIERRLIKERLRIELSGIDLEDEGNDTASDNGASDTRQRTEKWVDAQHAVDIESPSGVNAAATKPIAPAASVKSGRSPESATDIEKLIRAMTKIATYGDKSLKLPEFSGISSEWLAFKSAYEEQSRRYDNAENLARLRRSLRGEAKATVSGQLITGGSAESVIKQLERRYGCSENLARATLADLKKLPIITEGSRQLKEFACAVSNAVHTLRALKQERLLHSFDAAEIVKSKMETLRWRYIDYHHEQRDSPEPELVLLSQFLERETDKAAVSWTLDKDAAPSTRTSRDPRVTRDTHGVRHGGHNPTRYTAHAITDNATSTSKTKTLNCAHCETPGHAITECGAFKKLDVEERWNAVTALRLCFRCLKGGHRTYICRAKSKCTVKNCSRSHHTLLHRPTHSSDLTPPLHQEPPHNSVNTATETATETAACTRGDDKLALVKILPVTVRGPSGSVRTYALLDSGATITLISASIASQIGATGPSEPFNLKETTVTGKHDSQRIDFEITGPSHSTFKITNARTLQQLDLITQTVGDYSHLEHLKGLPIMPYANVTPEVLIGTDNFHLLAAEETRSGGRNEPSAVRTLLGWVIVGPTGGNLCKTDCAHVTYFVGHTARCDEELDVLLKSSYDLDALGVSTNLKLNKDDERAIQTLRATCRRVDDGQRWEAGLLWCDEFPIMPPSRSNALKRLRALEIRMDRDSKFGEDYVKQLTHLIEAGYARPALPTADKKLFYLPHFAVINPNKPGKIRVVFDAAARVDGRSLNDALMTGPDLLQSLLGVIFRFREGRFAVSADIREMFLRVKIREEDRPAQRFFWREWDRSSPPLEYEMAAMIFGAASSPTTALYVKNLNAQEFADEFPDAAMAIVYNFYMDDYLHSFNDVETAARISNEVKTVCARGGFELTGWATNCTEILKNIGTEPAMTRDLGPQTPQQKTLGMRWDPTDDKLGFNLGLARVPRDIVDGLRRPTKREMLRLVMSIFDPLGLLAPIIVQAKVLLQSVWRSGIGWDEQVADKEAEQWEEWLRRLRNTWQIKLPRCYFMYAFESEMQLHTFCDASEAAYAAVCYLRFTRRDGSIHTTLVASKSRVAPLKPTSIPRLELQAALLGSRLAATVALEHTFKISQKTYWTDSRTVLQWIRGDPRNYKPFVSHRLSEIEELTEPTTWRWISTIDNVADDATRSLQLLDADHRWYSGPKFLQQPEEYWPVHQTIATTTEELRQVQEVAATTTARVPSACLPDPKRFSRWTRLVRAAAYVILFVDKCHRRCIGGLQRYHLDRAEELLLRESQNEAFGTELKNLGMQQPLPKGSRLQHLSPFIDELGVMRLRGRASSTPNIDRRTAEPIILCGRHLITRLLVHHHHVLTHHAGCETVVNQLRQMYWVVHLRPTVRAVERACQMCRLRRATTQAPPMGDLREARLGHHHRPFTYCGLDYFGPMDVAVGRRREKKYGALFTCLVTRAVHVEIAGSLTTDSAISALRRMIARRGSPAVIYSDNGTNFRGAAIELRRAWSELDQATIKTFALQRGADWRFIPPGAPFMGGAWERLIGSIKRALRATLHQRAPTEEVLATLLAEAEHTVNSRPLTHVSVNPADPEALTPMHFLLGSSSGAPTPGAFADADLLRRQHWRAAQRLADLFWERWMREYLPTLLPRPLHADDRPELRAGDFVLIADGHLPRNTGPRGIVERTLPGKDGHVRVVDVRTNGGVLRRPARRIVRLPVDRVSEEAPPADRGENVADGRRIII